MQDKGALNMPLLMGLMGAGMLSANQPRPYSQGPVTLGGALGQGAMTGFSLYDQLMPKQKDAQYKVIGGKLIKITDGVPEVMGDYSDPKAEKLYATEEGYLPTEEAVGKLPHSKKTEKAPVIKTFIEGSKEVTKQYNFDTGEWETLSEGSRWKPDSKTDKAPVIREFKEGDKIVTREYNFETGKWEDIGEADRFKEDENWSETRYNAEIDAAIDLLTKNNIDPEKPLEDQLKPSLQYQNPALAKALADAYVTANRKRTKPGGKWTVEEVE